MVYVLNVFFIVNFKYFFIIQKLVLLMWENISEFVLVMIIRSFKLILDMCLMIGEIIFVVVVNVIVVEFVVIWINLVIKNVSISGDSDRCLDIWLIVVFILLLINICLKLFFVLIIKIIDFIGSKYFFVSFLIIFFVIFWCFLSR